MRQCLLSGDQVGKENKNLSCLFLYMHLCADNAVFIPEDAAPDGRGSGGGGSGGADLEDAALGGEALGRRCAEGGEAASRLCHPEAGRDRRLKLPLLEKKLKLHSKQQRKKLFLFDHTKMYFTKRWVSERYCSLHTHFKEQKCQK